jgi:hypothetical protein
MQAEARASNDSDCATVRHPRAAVRNAQPPETASTHRAESSNEESRKTPAATPAAIAMASATEVGMPNR